MVGMAYIVMACIAMAYIVMTYVVMAKIYRLHNSTDGLGLHSYGPYSYDLCSYGWNISSAELHGWSRHDSILRRHNYAGHNYIACRTPWMVSSR